MILVLLTTVAFAGLYARFTYAFIKASQNARTGHRGGKGAPHKSSLAAKLIRGDGFIAICVYDNFFEQLL